MPTTGRRATETETPAAETPSNGQPAAQQNPSAAVPDIPVQFAPGAEVSTTVTHKVEGHIAGATASSKLTREQIEAIERQRRRQHDKKITNLDEWLDYWRDFSELFGEDDSSDITKFKMSVTREADGLVMPGQPAPFATVCTEDRPLGKWPFTTDINRFIGHLQAINNNSGGRFRVTLLDGDGDYIRKDWIDRHGIPLEGHQNASWSGSIPNPIGVKNQNAQTQQPKKEEDELTTLAKDIVRDKLKKIVAGEDENKTSILSQVEAQAAGMVVTTMGTALTSVMQAAAQFNKAEDTRGFFEKVFTSEPIQARAIGIVDGVINIAEKIAQGYLDTRARKQQFEQEMEMRRAGINPPPAAPENKTSIYDYILNKCEARERINFYEDAEFIKLKTSDFTTWQQIKGGLESFPPEQILRFFISRCEMQGKGEKAKQIAALGQTMDWIRKLKESANPETTENAPQGE